MRDIWAFLIQTLSASGAALLLLLLKAIFRDKLSPRWQFGIWGILGLALLAPAGLFGRYALVNWPLAVETLKTLLTGDLTLTRVVLPIPLPQFRLPTTLWDWLFLIYLAGVLILLIHYILSYARLRMVLREGTPVSADTEAAIQDTAQRYSLPTCPAIAAAGISSAFICGVFRPILVLPADGETDEKVLLHELLHLKHRDAVWGVVICLLRCLHWCNPLLWYCAKRACNDLEARCDQRVLECLEGEDRREYGHILLSMANEKYASTPGTTSAANGGKNIRRRIEAIARFKLYPAGMTLVSVCMAILLALPLVVGTKATSVKEFAGNGPDSKGELALAFASARTTWCSTPAGALDAYGKALLAQNGIYRAMCAPSSMQEEIWAVMEENMDTNVFPMWDIGIDSWPNSAAGYYVYNLTEQDGIYEAQMVIQINYPPNYKQATEGTICVAFQPVRVEKEGARWVVIPTGEFEWTESRDLSLDWGCLEPPSHIYTAEAAGFRVEILHQTVTTVDNTAESNGNVNWAFGHSGSFFNYDLLPKPDARFTAVRSTDRAKLTWLGSEEEKDSIRSLGISYCGVMAGEERPGLQYAGAGNSGGSSSDGRCWGSVTLKSGWDSVQYIHGGGSSFPYNLVDTNPIGYYAADLYINGTLAAELDLRLQEGVSR